MLRLAWMQVSGVLDSAFCFVYLLNMCFRMIFSGSLAWFTVSTIYGTMRVEEPASEIPGVPGQQWKEESEKEWQGLDILPLNTKSNAGDHSLKLEHIRSEPDVNIGWLLDYAGLHLSGHQIKRRPPLQTGKLRKMFGWGDFQCSIKSASLDLLIKGKIVDHGNGTFSVHFLCNTTGFGNISVALVPSTKIVEFGIVEQVVRKSVESRLFNCRVESEKVERSWKRARCQHGLSNSCQHQQTHSHISWLCSKPFKVICVYVSFHSVNYKLLQKVCPDYNYHSDVPYFPIG